MRLVLAALAFAASLFALPAGSAAVEGSYEDVSTRIEVKLDDRLSSQESKVGDVFHFELTGSVFLGGMAVGAETRGHGVVTAVQPGAGPQHGSLTVEARSIDLPDGEHFPVGLAPGSLDKRLTNVVYEKGTKFFVISPPPQTPEPETSGGS
jgi:hypothetical protein